MKRARLIERKVVTTERRQRLFEQLVDEPVVNHKWQRQSLELDFDAECSAFLNLLAERVISDQSNCVQRFLTESVWPESLIDLQLSDDERVLCLVMNALKQWVAKESAYLDTLLTGGQFRAKLKSLAVGRYCTACASPLTEQSVELHHTVRDGRPPVPICKECHKQLERQSKEVADEDTPVMQQIKQTRKKCSASWSNLQKAVRAIQGIPHDDFGTAKVASSSKSIARRIMKETDLSVNELQQLVDRMGA